MRMSAYNVGVRELHANAHAKNNSVSPRDEKQTQLSAQGYTKLYTKNLGKNKLLDAILHNYKIGE